MADRSIGRDQRPAFGAPRSAPWLQGFATLASLYLVVLVLAGQRREDELKRRGELLGLELAILSEQKTAKVIALIPRIMRCQMSAALP